MNLKKLKSRYSLSNINSNSYQSLTVSGNTTNGDIKGYVYVPYIMTQSTPSREWEIYFKRQERIESSLECAEGLITNVSNMPYQNPIYSLINSVGRQWIFEMTLAICKEILGYVRGKYSTVPIPNADMTLNQADLLSAATAEKTALLEGLRAYFDETSRANMLERKAREIDAVIKELDQVPRVIYIG